MSKNVNKYLYDALMAVDAIEKFVDRMSYENFLNDTKTLAAVERKFEIIGEALNRVRKEDDCLANKIQDCDRIIGFRNLLAHGYDIIEEEIVWNAIKKHLPNLKKSLQKILNNENSN